MKKTQWLIQSTCKRLEESDVPLHELRSDLRKRYPKISKDKSYELSGRAQEALLARPDVELVWLSWPSRDALDLPLPSAFERDHYTIPTSEPYLALRRR